MNHRSLSLSVTVLLLGLRALPGQATIQVGGPGGLPDIRAALAVAQPGDELVVQPGAYPYFEADVGVTIRAATPGTVSVYLDAASLPTNCQGACLATQFTRLVPPAGQELHVVGIDFVGPVVQVGGGVMSNQVRIDGRVSMRDCTIETGVSMPLVVEPGSDVHLQSCSVRMNYQFNNTTNLFAGVARLTGSQVTAVDCEFLKLDGLTLAQPMLQCVDSTLQASGVTIRRVPAVASVTYALQLINSTAWVSDSQLVATLGCAVIPGSGQLFVDRTTIVDGVTGCQAGISGGARVGASDSGAPTAGAPYSVTCRTAPNTLVGVFAAPSLEVAAVPGIPQPTWLPLATALPAALLVSDAAGVATATWQLPVVSSATRPRLWLQAVSGVLPLQVGPAVGGVVR